MVKDYAHFKIEALVAKQGVVPGYDEVVFEGDDGKSVAKVISWRTDVAQAVAKAANLPNLSADEEMIIIVRRHEED
jgi:hypothetical protein